LRISLMTTQAARWVAKFRPPTADLEETASIDVRAWPRRGSLMEGRLFTHQWPSGARIGIRVGRDTVTLIDTAKMARRSINAWACLATTLWLSAVFLCRCGRQSLVLDPRLGHWACRECCGFGYRSDLELMTHRGEMRAVVDAASIRWRSMLTPDTS
jgi:hypothetical protein